VLIVLIGYSAYRYRINRLMEMHRMRLRIAGDLHDEIGSNLSTIVVASDMIGRRAKLEEHDRSQLNDIARTALQTANGMREIVWFINPEHDRMDDLLLKMKDVAIAMLGDLSYGFHSPDAVLDIHLTPEVRRNIFLIFKESVNNIVRHSRAGHVDIDIRVEGGMFRMKISDDGVGFDHRTIRRGEGLNNLRKRASAIGAELTIESIPNKGTATLLTARTSHLGRSRI
jgi:signal transduction histidine kinase